jgi:hypothetical protein
LSGAIVKLASITFWSIDFFLDDKTLVSYWGKLAVVLIIPFSWGSQLDGDLHYHTPPHQAIFLALLPGKKKTSVRGVSHAHPLLCFKFCFTLFYLHRFIKNTKN